MSGTDFFDDDLIQKRDEVNRVRVGSGDEKGSGVPAAPSDTLPKRQVGDLNLTRMAKHRDDVEDQVARTTEELERLRQRQETLEKERRDLQELRSRQDEFEENRRDLIEKLGQNILTLERDEIRAAQVSDLVITTRQRFKTMLKEIEELDAEQWEDAKIRDELGKALAIMEDARMEFNKSMAKVETIRDQGIASEEDKKQIMGKYDAGHVGRADARKPFSYWLGVGFAVSLPVIVTIILVAIVLYVLMSRGLI